MEIEVEARKIVFSWSFVVLAGKPCMYSSSGLISDFSIFSWKPKIEKIKEKRRDAEANRDYSNENNTNRVYQPPFGVCFDFDPQ